MICVEVHLVQLVKKRKSVILDVSNWESVPLEMRHLLVLEGRLDFLLRQYVDVEKYIKDLAEIYLKVVERLRKSEESYAPLRKCVGKMAALVLSATDADSADLSTLLGAKMWIENIIKLMAEGAETYSGKARIEVVDGRVYVGGLYSPGHTYLRSLGYLTL